MCGIAGIRRFGPEPITEDQITILLCANARRGIQATGIALQQPNGTISVLKSDEPAWRFVTDDKYKKFLRDNLFEDTVTFLGHTRAATQGTPEDNSNNHPLYGGTTAVVHNGMISNDHTLFASMKLKRLGEVDSDILRAILDEHGLTRDGVKELKRVCGSVAIAAVSRAYPGKLLLGRSGSPLVLASTPNQLVWSSEKAAIHAAMRPCTWRFGLPMQPNRADLAFMTMNNDSVYLIGENQEREEKGERWTSAIDWHESFRVANFYSAPNYKVHDDYRHKRGRYRKDTTEDKKKRVHMLWCKTCHKWLDVPKGSEELAVWEFTCKTCNNRLQDPPTTEDFGQVLSGLMT